MPARCVNSISSAVDFERVLKTASAARTPHFAVHHVKSRPAVRKPSPKPQLSTAPVDAPAPLVDESAPGALWLGLVVPKRHAKRSVTRSLLKRQIRAAVQRCPALGDGLWVVRLRSPFDRKAFPSAASAVLGAVARAELDGLLQRAAQRSASPASLAAPASTAAVA